MNTGSTEGTHYLGRMTSGSTEGTHYLGRITSGSTEGTHYLGRTDSSPAIISGQPVSALGRPHFKGESLMALWEDMQILAFHHFYYI